MNDWAPSVVLGLVDTAVVTHPWDGRPTADSDGRRFKSAMRYGEDSQLGRALNVATEAPSPTLPVLLVTSHAITIDGTVDGLRIGSTI